jgi:competence protein ComEC
MPAAHRNASADISEGKFAIKENFATPLKVYVISDGHADSVLVSKGEFNMLVDAGNFPQADAFLKKLGITRLHVVVATRDYAGAIGGLPAILDAYQVDELWENGAAQQGSDYYSLLEKARMRGITLKKPVALDGMEVNGLAVTVLNPQQQRIFSNPDNDAIVLKLSAGGFCMLLLNPTVQERENAIISTGESLRCDAATYYKHGEGRPEPSLLIGSYALPKDVIISVGRNNSVGLPSNTTITRLALKSVKVWRTDTDGTVLVEAASDGSSYKVSGNK